MLRIPRHTAATLTLLAALSITAALPAADTATEPAEKKPAESERPNVVFAAGRAIERPKRLAPRPERSAEERQSWIAELRALYSQSPDKWPTPHVDEGVEWRELGLLPEVVHPESNPFSQAKADLGKMLFFDPRLSGSGQIACASCHDPDLAWADGRVNAFGHDRFKLHRNAPTIVNTAYYDVLFWDGRAGSLEEQAHAVILNPLEMNATEEVVVERLNAEPEYRAAFANAFCDETITLDRVAQALATFERTIVTTGRSRFDAFLRGKHEALSDEALAGLDLYRREARCMNCHHGPNFSDSKLHNLGLSYYGRKYEDLGQYQVTKLAEDVGRFRTPTLRNIVATRPYMHNGLFELEGVLNMYNAGMGTLLPKEHQLDDPLFPIKSPHLKPLRLNKQDLSDLRAFLETLSEPRLRIRPPYLPGLSPASEAPAKEAETSDSPT